MPKSFLNDYDRKISSFRSWFKGRRATEGVTQEHLARKMGVSQTTLSRKTQVKGYKQSEITYRDLLYFFKEVNATDEEILRYMKL